MDIDLWQFWFDLFSTSPRRPGAFMRILWDPYGLLVRTPLISGLLFLAVSFVRPRRWVTLPTQDGRLRILTRFGFYGPLAILVIATVAGVILVLFPGFTMQPHMNGSWFRAATPFVICVVLLFALRALTRERQPAVGERAILPRRKWNSFAPKPLYWAVFAGTMLYLITELWQASVSSEPREIPSITGGDRVLKNVGGGGLFTAMGWENHAASLLCISLVALFLVWVLAADSHRPVSSHRPYAEVKLDRMSTAKLVCQVALGGVLIALGMVWIHTWAPITGYVSFQDDRVGGTSDLLISDYYGLASTLKTLGSILLGLGAGTLMRLLIDTVRARRAASAEQAALPTNQSTPHPHSASEAADHTTPSTRTSADR